MEKVDDNGVLPRSWMKNHLGPKIWKSLIQYTKEKYGNSRFRFGYTGKGPEIYMVNKDNSLGETVGLLSKVIKRIQKEEKRPKLRIFNPDKKRRKK